MTISQSQKAQPVLGLIGGIGSGKSLVAAELVKQGGFLISGDLLGHEALYQPEIKEKVIQRFGEDITDGQGNIIRRKLGAKVFTAREELQALEELVFPFIEKRIKEEIAHARQKPEIDFIVLDAAIMVETGWDQVCDALIFVDAPRPVRLQRLAKQRGWKEKEVANREKMQMDLSLKKQRADHVVDNAGSPESIPGQVRDILRRLGLPARSA
jgi:dephospho-CoA kinase